MHTGPLPAKKILYRDSVPAPTKFVPPLLQIKSGAGATHVMLNKICTMPTFAKASAGEEGKKCAPAFASLQRGRLPLPGCLRQSGKACTVTAFRLKYQDPAWCCRRVTVQRGRLATSLEQPTGLFLNARASILPGRLVT